MSAAVQIIEPEAEVRAAMRAIGAEARLAGRKLAIAPTETKNQALTAAARALRVRSAEILAASSRDLAHGEAKGLSKALIDRLALNPDRIEAVARGLDEVADLPDPVGRVLATFTRPNGLVIERVARLIDISQLDGRSHADLAGIRLLAARQHPKQGGLAGAVGADDADDAAAR